MTQILLKVMSFVKATYLLFLIKTQYEELFILLSQLTERKCKTLKIVQIDLIF